MNFSYNWLQSFFKRKLPSPEKLADLLSRRFAEVEEIRKENKDFVLDIDIRPNRAGDCFSHLGTAREVAAILNFKLQIANGKLIEDKKLKAKNFIHVDVRRQHQQACSRYTVRVICDVKVGPSPKWIQERLKVCGLRTINNIVDIANYVMLETGQPLHAFDFFKIESENSKFEIRNSKQIQNSKFKIPNEPKKIIVRFAKKGEKIFTLDNEEYDLDNDVLVIADSKEPLAIAGIKGGKKAEITEQTKIVVLESANFNPKVIRGGSRKIDLKTDASRRFEHEIDPNLTEIAINRAAGLIQEIARQQGGYPKVTHGLVDFYPKKVLPKKIKLDLNYVASLLGVEIPNSEIKNILKRLSFKYNENSSRCLEVLAPTFRLDVSIPEDLIEEIGRIYGYEKIPPKLPFSTLIPPKRNLEVFWEDVIKNILKEAGFTEVYNYSFISEKDISIYQLNQHKSAVLEVENPTSADYQYLRPSLIPGLLKNIAKNQRFLTEPRIRASSLRGEIKIFELGKTFKKFSIFNYQFSNKPEIKNISEKRMLSGVITGDAFYEAKGVIDLLLNKMGISNVWYNDYQPTPEESKLSIWHSSKRAEIKIGQEEIGFLGEVSPKTISDLKLKGKAVVFDVDFEKLQKLASEEHEYQPISPYPAAIRDIAILAPRNVKVEEVLNVIETAGGELIRDIDLFDIYEGEEIPEGKKNLAFHIIYQAEDRTLSSAEIDGVQQKIIKSLEENPDWEVRK